MKNKTSLLVNVACLLVPAIFFHLCLQNVQTQAFGMSFVWGIVFAVGLLRYYPVVSLGFLAILAALLISKRIRVPQKIAHVGLSLMVGYIVGAIWFISHMNDSAFFPISD